ncbi:TonB-dependent receptor [Dasania marina]|uniref:TonB-dependent receptor n=1 Tax=Dasania marina TaxID=471499 RepID=UPI0030D7E688|tara:strand:+ start:39713 stop:42022 length:2310 start_codon:yes stop_codon:yes gene_type:complete
MNRSSKKIGIQSLLVSNSLTTTSIAVLLSASSALADNRGSSLNLEEVLVTASKRGAAQRVQDLPQAIQAMGGNKLDILGATQFDQWATQISGLNFEDDGPGDKDYVIRGVNSDLGGTVGVYIDEAVVTGKFTQNGGGHQLDIKLHDMERIEVLKGPQGTLYGANSMSGTIRQITNKPSLNKTEASVDAELSSTKKAGDLNTVLSGMVNVPIIEDVLGLRAVGWRHDTSGYVDNIRLGDDDINTEDVSGGRVHLAWQPSESFDLLLSYSTQDLESGGRSRFIPQGSAYPGSTSPLGSLPMPEIAPSGDFQNGEYARTPWNEDVGLVSLTANWNLEFGTVTTTYNQLKRDIDYAFDSTPILIAFGVPVPAVSEQSEDREITSMEVRFASNFEGPVNFVAGYFRQEEDLEFEIGVVTVDGNGDATGPLTAADTDDFFLNGGNSIFGRTFTEDSVSSAAFGEVHVDLNSQWGLDIGGRWFDSEASTDSREIHPFVGFQGRDRVFQKRSVDDSKFTGKFNVSWAPTESELFYLAWSQGFRQGGVNSTIVLDPSVVLPDGFDSDELTNIELGFKTTWLDERLILNGALYRTVWDNMQVEDSLSGFSFTDNIGETNIDGLEFDLTWKASGNLELGLGGAFVDTELQDDEPVSVGIGRGLTGDELPMVPEFTGYAFAQYTQQLSNGLETFYYASTNYRGSTQTELNQANPYYHEIDSYMTANLSATLMSENWKVTLFVNNATDEEGPVDVNENLDNALSYVPVTPRTFGVRTSYTFF